MRRTTVLPSILVTAVLGAAAACTGNDPTPVLGATDGGTSEEGGGPGSDATAPDAGADAAVLEGSLSLDTPIPVVAVGKSIEVTVTLDRKGVVAGDVSITVAGLPSGVTASVPPIPAASTKTKLSISADAAATVGDVKITLSARKVTTLESQLVVAGLPGTADISFDSDGIVLETGAPQSSARGLALQDDGKLVVVGTNGSGWLVRRYDAMGAADAAFNTAAAAVIPSSGMARAVAVDPTTKKITVVGGSVSNGTFLTIVRLNATGSADQGFGSGGTMRMNSVDHSGGSDGYAVALVGADTVVAGRRLGPDRAMLEKFGPNGARAAGFVFYEGGAMTNFSALGVTSAGALVAAGTDAQTAPPRHFAARFVSNGSADVTFNGGAARTFAVGCRASGGAMLADGDMLIVGSSVTAPQFCETRFAASGDGQLVFARNAPGGGSQDDFTAAAASDNASSVAVGHGGGSQDRFARILERRKDGAVSVGFGSIDFEDPAVPDTFRDQFFAVVSTRDGRFVIGGERSLGTKGLLLRRVWR